MEFLRQSWIRAAAWSVCGLALASWGQTPAAAQRWGLSGQYLLSDTLHLDLIDSAGKKHLVQARASAAGEQWQDCLDIYERLIQEQGHKLIQVSSQGYVPVEQFCHLCRAQLPAAGLEVYRRHADPIADNWYRQAVEQRSPELLRRIVDEAFCASSTDEALLALGAWSLEQADYSSARMAWAQILPAAAWDTILEAMRTPERPEDKLACETLYGLWRALVQVPPVAESPNPWLAYPDSDIAQADVLARLALVSILEGSLERARLEMAALQKLHPQASGIFLGGEGPYVARLESLRQNAASWRSLVPLAGWPSFGGTAERNGISAGGPDVGSIAWTADLGDAPTAGRANPTNFGYSQRRIADNANGPILSYYPIVHQGVVYVAKENEIFAFDLATGKPAFGDHPVLYSETMTGSNRPNSSLGSPRFTLTAHGQRLYARLGRPETTDPQDASPLLLGRGKVVCLDLTASGSLLWQIEPSEERFNLEGSPVVDDFGVYLTMRKSDVRPQVHVAAFDPATGGELWRQFIVGAETPAQGKSAVAEITHTLLTLDHGTLYVNTNLGAVAALDARTGKVRWLTTYPRARTKPTQSDAQFFQSGAHFYRDLTPCVLDKGRVFVAPSDCELVFALDAASGRPLWRSSSDAASIVHLLGVADGKLIASGRNLWWFDVDTGKVLRRFPENDLQLQGFGRGMLAGNNVYWPTRAEVLVFDQQSTEIVDRIPLDAKGASGGNLVVLPDWFLVATSKKLFALDEYSRAAPETAPPNSPEMAQRTPANP